MRKKNAKRLVLGTCVSAALLFGVSGMRIQAEADSTVIQESAEPAVYGGGDGVWNQALFLRTGEKNAVCQYLCGDGGLDDGETAGTAGNGQCVDVGGFVHTSDLFRFFGIFGYGDRIGKNVWI